MEIAEALRKKQSIENNANTENPSFMDSAVRDFQPGTTHKAKNINAGQVTDRDGLPRIDGDKNTADNILAENLALNSSRDLERWPTQRPAWKNGTLVTDHVLTEPRTGKTAEQAIYTNITTDNAKENSGALKNNFDKGNVLKEINLQVSVTQQFDANRQEVKQEINKKLDDAKQQNLEVLEKEKNHLALTDQEKQQLKAYYQTVENYQKLGLVLDTVAAGLSAPTNSVTGIGAAALSPTASYEIGQYFKNLANQNANGKLTSGQETAHIAAHTILGAAVAAIGGNDILTAGLSAGGAEASASMLAQYLYGKKPSDLTADEKGTISSITGLIASGIGASTGDIGSTVQSGQVAQNAVENNEYAKYLKCNVQSQCVWIEEKPVEQFTFFEENFIRPISVLFGVVGKANNVKKEINNQNNKAPNLSPEGAGRSGAFNKAKSDAGIPTSMQPKEVRPNMDKRGNIQPGKQYVYEVPKAGGGTKTVIIRDDSKGHIYKDDPSQNRGPHFNTPNKDHYDY